MHNELRQKEEKLSAVVKACNVGIIKREKFTGQRITVEQIDKLLATELASIKSDFDFEFNSDEIELIRFRLQSGGRLVRVEQANRMAGLQGSHVTPWEAMADIDWKLWAGYKQMLEHEGKSRDVIDDNEQLVDEVLRLSGDPSTVGPWLRKGLVMGNVQAGKTLNFIGLVNKAIDAGYHTIIVLGGHLNELRQQTQERIDEGALGQNTSAQGKTKSNNKVVAPALTGPYGVAQYDNLDQAHSLERPHAGTTHGADFSAPSANSLGLNINARTPTIFVIKKHTTIMANLTKWLVSKLDARSQNMPMLLIDDEADYASINTKLSSNQVAATNEKILGLLNIFSRRTYVGYTATPFANVFIPTFEGNFDLEKQDLFPADFMLKMPIPTNYCGQDFFFPSSDSDSDDDVDDSEIVGPTRIIDDHLSWLDFTHKKDVQVDYLSDSLKEAVLSYILVIAIRILRGDRFVHNTMLVNVSRFNNVQFEVAREIKDYVSLIKKSVTSFAHMKGTSWRENHLLARLEEVFDREFLTPAGDVEFEEVRLILREVLEKLKTVLVNGEAKKRMGPDAIALDYRKYKDEGLWVIAVGGQKLSRGITLEGLSVSYFLRSARAYDTLTQMCRWFGYRPRYEDLCRLWITDESETHYFAVARAIRELYSDLRLMELSNATPRDFGMRVLADDLSLLITAKNKMGTAKKLSSRYVLWGRVWRRMAAYLSEEKNSYNFQVFDSHIREIEARPNVTTTQIKPSDPIVLNNVDYDDIIYLLKEGKHPLIGERAELIPAVAALEQMGESGLDKPQIFLFNQARNKLGKNELSAEDIDFFNSDFSFAGHPIKPRARTMKRAAGYVYDHRQTVGNSDDLSYCFSAEEQAQIKSVEAKSRLVNKDFQKHLTHPVLMVYFLHALVKTEPNEVVRVEIAHSQKPTLVFNIYFPEKAIAIKAAGLENDASLRELDRERSYYVNEVMRGYDGETLTIEDLTDEEEMDEAS